MTGFDPMLQLIHMHDVARALVAALEPGLKGVYNVVGPGEVPLSKVFAELGARPRSVPHLLARPLLGTLFKYRLAEFPTRGTRPFTVPVHGRRGPFHPRGALLAAVLDEGDHSRGAARFPLSLDAAEPTVCTVGQCWPWSWCCMWRCPPGWPCCRGSGETTELRLQPLGAAELAPVVARLTHADGSTVVGAVAGALVVATATTAPAGDLSYASALFRLEPSRPTRQLIDRVALAARPVVLEGRVFVPRGKAGPGHVDELTLDEVDLETGAARTVYATRGFFAHLAGAFGRELVVYEVTPAGARVLMVHVDTLGVRVARDAMPALAHDFVVDPAGARLVYTLGEPGIKTVAPVEETPLGVLAAKARRSLASGDSVALLPTVWPDGRVLRAAGPGRGLIEAGGAAERVVQADDGARPSWPRVRAGAILRGRRRGGPARSAL